jgi:hypothetical protein
MDYNIDFWLNNELVIIDNFDNRDLVLEKDLDLNLDLNIVDTTKIKLCLSK